MLPCGVLIPRRIRLVLAGLVVLLVLGGVLSSAVAARVRARSRVDWLESKNLTLAPVVKGLVEPTYVAGAPDGSNRLFILERAGRVRVASGDGQLLAKPALDLGDAVSTGGEQGMLGLAFDPDFLHNGLVYIDYTAADSSVQVVRYSVVGDQLDTPMTVLSLPKKSKYHNGGMLAFGPDGYLYIGVGDDENSDGAQELGNVFGKILRIDVTSTEPYAIPPSNPFAQRDGARGEIWSYGLRNPWRFSFDRATGAMWIGDVGDARWEEIDLQPPDSAGGENYGWPMNEGTECEQPERCHAEGLVAPIVTYGHNMNCAVAGGYIYRGKDVPGLVGTYIFGDLCTGGVFAARGGPEQGWQRVELGFQPIKISSFGEDAAAELYVCDFQGGVIYRIAEASLP
jgi:glucose/arabinose dehydrogenase